MKVDIRADAGSTIVEQMLEAFRELIGSRSLGAGKKLPSIRRFAEANGVSKSTVVEVYDRLVAEGLVTSRPKSGFFVSQRRPVCPGHADVGRRPEREIDPLWMLRHSLEVPAEMPRPGCGWLPPSMLPGEGVRRALRAVARADDDALTSYGSPLGFEPLRTALQRLMAARGVEAGLGSILLTDSGSQAIELAVQMFLRPGEVVLVDDPCYFNYQAVLGMHRAKVVAVPFLSNGPDVAALERIAEEHRPKLYVTNATLHNPTGATLSAPVAHKVLKVAERHDFVIVEDDTFADFEERPSTRLASLDELQRVVYLGSFSKTLSGAVRCGYITARPDWAEGLVDLKLAKSFGNNEASARLIHHLLTDGSYRKHMDAVRVKLRRMALHARRQIRECGMELWHEPEEGLFLWVDAGEGVDTAALARSALGCGILLAPGNVFSLSHNAGRFLRFNVAHSQDPRIFAFLRQARRTGSQ